MSQMLSVSLCKQVMTFADKSVNKPPKTKSHSQLSLTSLWISTFADLAVCASFCSYDSFTWRTSLVFWRSALQKICPLSKTSISSNCGMRCTPWQPYYLVFILKLLIRVAEYAIFRAESLQLRLALCVRRHDVRRQRRHRLCATAAVHIVRMRDRRSAAR